MLRKGYAERAFLPLFLLKVAHLMVLFSERHSAYGRLTEMKPDIRAASVWHDALPLCLSFQPLTTLSSPRKVITCQRKSTQLFVTWYFLEEIVNMASHETRLRAFGC